MVDRAVIALAVVSVVGTGCGSKREDDRVSDRAPLMVEDQGGGKRVPDPGEIVVEHPLPPGPVIPPARDAIDDAEVVLDGPDGAVIALELTGLDGYDAPDLVVRDVPSVMTDAAEELLMATARAVLAGTPVAGDSTIEIKTLGGTTPTIRVHLSRDGKRIALVFPGPRARVTERVVAVLELWSPPEQDQGLDWFEEDDQIQAAVRTARRELRELGRSWRNGSKDGEVLRVDAAFDAGDNWEYLEVDVIRIDGDTIEGILIIPPGKDVKGNLKVGSKVTTRIDEVLDYEWTSADGEDTRGGKVNALIDSREK